jgi:crossover junction endodeoxyribonuclease RusA
MTTTDIILPWPPSQLSPNARVHWATLAKAKKSYRLACAWQAKCQGAHKIEAEALRLTLTFYPPSRRAFDLDNALARMKAGLDGLADVLGVDDSRWTLTIAKAEDIGGMVRVEIRHAGSGSEAEPLGSKIE